VKWRGDGSLALDILKNAGAKNLEVVGSGVTFDFEGDTDALDQLLKTLITRDVRIAEWRGVGDDLEQIFLQSGAKELM